MNMIKRTVACGVIACIGLTVGCASPKGETPQAQRDYAISMKDKALATVYAKHPEARSAVEGAPGYMAIEGIAWGIGFLGSGGGYGVATDNATKQVTYIRLFHFMPGFGIAGKGYKEL